MSEGALYRHFPSKEQLVWQVFERHYIEFAGRLLKLAESESGTREKLAAMIAGFCRAYDENPRSSGFFFSSSTNQLGKLAADAPTPVEAVRMVIARGIARASSRRRTPTSPVARLRRRAANRSSSPRTGGCRRTWGPCANDSSPRPGPPHTV